tara:strand:- start:333 stop:1133 length:801 start_codon:yes stop_codon:yes gene_type:complete
MLGLGNSLTGGVALDTDTYVDPSSFGNLALWLKFNTAIFADDPDAGDVSTMSHNDKINQWQDQSGNNNHAVQTTTADKPRWDLTPGTDVGAPKFANSAKFMDLTTPIGITGDFTIMIRFRVINVNAPRSFVGNSSTDLFRAQDTTEFRSIIGGSGTSAWDETSAAALSVNDATKRQIVTFTRESGALSVHVNGGTSAGGWKNEQDDVDWDAAESHSDSDTFTISNIGCSADDSENQNGWFYDVLIYDGIALNTTQRKQNYDYLNGQ